MWSLAVRCQTWTGPKVWSLQACVQQSRLLTCSFHQTEMSRSHTVHHD